MQHFFQQKYLIPIAWGNAHVMKHNRAGYLQAGKHHIRNCLILAQELDMIHS